MDGLAGLTGNYFFKKKSIFNTKSQKFLVARPWINRTNPPRQRAMVRLASAH